MLLDNNYEDTNRVQMTKKRKKKEKKAMRHSMCLLHNNINKIYVGTMFRLYIIKVGISHLSLSGVILLYLSFSK